MVTLNSEAGRRLHDELTARFGPIEDGHGRKVYGHKSTAAAWREGVLADLRGEAVAPPTILHESPPCIGLTVVRTTPPSAAQAGRSARTACACIAIVGLLGIVAAEGNLFGMLASLPLSKLVGVALGRIG